MKFLNNTIKSPTEKWNFVARIGHGSGKRNYNGIIKGGIEISVMTGIGKICISFPSNDITLSPFASLHFLVEDKNMQFSLPYISGAIREMYGRAVLLESLVTHLL